MRQLTLEEIGELNSLRERASKLRSQYHKGLITPREFYPNVAIMMSQAKCIVFYPDDEPALAHSETILE